MSTPSTQFSRNLVLRNRSRISHVLVQGDQPYIVDPPRVLAAGRYRAELDPDTRTATVTLIALTKPEDHA